MSFRTTGFLLIILTILGIFVYVYEVRGIGKPNPEARKPLVLDIRADQVTRIEVRQGNTVVAMARELGQPWRMTSPYEAEGYQARMNGIANNLDSLRAERTIGEHVNNLADFGLDPPQWEATIGLADGRSFEILGGQTLPDFTGVYVKRRDADSVYVVDYTAMGALSAMAATFPIVTPTTTPGPSPTATPTPTRTPIPERTPTPTATFAPIVTPTLR